MIKKQIFKHRKATKLLTCSFIESARAHLNSITSTFDCKKIEYQNKKTFRNGERKSFDSLFKFKHTSIVA